MKNIKSKKLLIDYINQFKLHDIFEKTIIDRVEIHEYEIGELIIREGEDQKFYYFLVKGKAKVCPSSEEGQVVLLDFMTPLDLIGDIEYVYKRPYYHDVLALKNTHLIAIPIPIVDNYLKRSLDFYKCISELMAKKIMTTSVKYSRAMMYPLKVRLANYLLEHYDDEFNQSVVIKFRDVADYFGITPRHLRRVISSFEERGIIERKVGHIIIHDLKALNDEAYYSRS